MKQMMQHHDVFVFCIHQPCEFNLEWDTHTKQGFIKPEEKEEELLTDQINLSIHFI